MERWSSGGHFCRRRFSAVDERGAQAQGGGGQTSGGVLSRAASVRGGWESLFGNQHPQVKAQLRKARSRRGRAAFPKVGAAVMVELGLHNPLAAALGDQGESELVLAKKVLAAQPEQSLLISDRYYGVAEVLVGLPSQTGSGMCWCGSKRTFGGACSKSIGTAARW